MNNKNLFKIKSELSRICRSKYLLAQANKTRFSRGVATLVAASEYASMCS